MPSCSYLAVLSPVHFWVGVGKKVIYQLIEFDEIRAVREHGKVMIDRSSLEAFHNSGKRP